VSRVLNVFNLLGVMALAVLCAIQWQTNRRLHLQATALEQARIEQLAQLADRDKAIKGYVADLDDFRERVRLSESQLKELDVKLGTMTRERNQLLEQRDQLLAQRDELKAALDKWVAAVRERDAALKDAAAKAQKLAADRNEAVVKFNELVGKYNAVVKDLNEARAKQ
jgi:septal ring factor EnvC (AmiA/AmiB activator)